MYNFVIILLLVRSLSGSKSPQVSRTLLSIPADFSSSVEQIVSILPRISRLFILVFRFLGTVLRALTTVGITVIFLSNSFFTSLARSRYLFNFNFLQFPSVVSLHSKINKMTSTFLLVMAHLAGAYEFTNCISEYDTKQSDSEAPVWGNAKYPFIAIAPWFTLAQKGPIYGSNRNKLCAYAKLNCLK